MFLWDIIEIDFFFLFGGSEATPLNESIEGGRFAPPQKEKTTTSLFSLLEDPKTIAE